MAIKREYKVEELGPWEAFVAGLLYREAGGDLDLGKPEVDVAVKSLTARGWIGKRAEIGTTQASPCTCEHVADLEATIEATLNAVRRYKAVSETTSMPHEVTQVAAAVGIVCNAMAQILASPVDHEHRQRLAELRAHIVSTADYYERRAKYEAAAPELADL